MIEEQFPVKFSWILNWNADLAKIVNGSTLWVMENSEIIGKCRISIANSEVHGSFEIKRKLDPEMSVLYSLANPYSHSPLIAGILIVSGQHLDYKNARRVKEMEEWFAS